MRIVMLCPSVYSETACAAAVRLADSGYTPSGALSLTTLNRDTLLRKFGQWGVERVANYARTKLFSRNASNLTGVQNEYLQRWLTCNDGVFRNLNQVANVYNFPVAMVHDQNSPRAIASLKAWCPDLIVFTGGDILRKEVLAIPRLGVLNVHLGLLPQIRGMSSPEWALLTGVPVGITIHFMDSGIDTGPILQRYEYPDLAHCKSLPDLRHRLIAFGLEKLGDVVAALDRGTMMSTPYCDLKGASSGDNQHFVMHEWLQAQAEALLTLHVRAPVAETVHG
jgi:folate-dependent phosphoribosylglycinamide formyltransferase PurN